MTYARPPRLGDSPNPAPMRLALVVLAVALSLPAAAQRGRPFAEKGDVALVAQVSGLEVLRLNPALGGIGARYRVTDRAVIGASVGLDVFDRDREGDLPGPGSESGTAVRVHVWNENHLGRAGGRISPFVGAGLGVEFQRLADEFETTDGVCLPDGTCGSFPVLRRQSARTAAFRGGVFVGAEVRLASRLTLGAAYLLGLGYENRTIEAEVAPAAGTPPGALFPVSRREESSTLRVGTGLTDLHLSVYF